MKIETDQNLKLFFHNRRLLIISVLFIWLSAFILFFALKPQINQIQQKRTELSQKRSQLNQLSKKTVELEQILSSAQFAQKDKVNEVLPSHKPLLELLSNLHQAAGEHEVVFTDFNISPGEVASPSAQTDMSQLLEQAKEEQQQSKAKVKTLESADNEQESQELTDEIQYSGKGYSELTLELSIKGRSEEVEGFMALMERVAPLTTITDFEINQAYQETELTASPSASQTGTISTASMIMATYYYDRIITTTPASTLPSVSEGEMAVFETIQKFRPSGFEPQTSLQSADLEDLFGVGSLVDQLQ